MPCAPRAGSDLLYGIKRGSLGTSSGGHSTNTSRKNAWSVAGDIADILALLDSPISSGDRLRRSASASCEERRRLGPLRRVLPARDTESGGAQRGDATWPASSLVSTYAAAEVSAVWRH